MNEQLNQAVELAKAGRKRETHALLGQLVAAEPGNESAWLWLSACAGSLDERVFCLRKALEINPANPKAQRSLQRALDQGAPRVVQPPPLQVWVMQASAPPVQKKSRLISILATLGLVALVFVILSLFGNHKPAAPQPTELPPLVIPAGQLSAHEDEITRDRVVNVYKKDGTLEDEREDDLKELGLNWYFYRQKILDYTAAGETAKADEARRGFENTNAGLNAYNENDVQTMLRLIEEKGWSMW
jgi:hypothetical protein